MPGRIGFSCVCLPVIAALSTVAANGQDIDREDSNRSHSRQQVEVTLRDGRSVIGRLQSRSDKHFLWIGRETAAIHLSSGFAWPEIQRVTAAGRTVEPDELLSRLRRSPPPAESEVTQAAAVDQLSTANPNYGVTLPAPNTRPQTVPERLTPKSLWVRAELANWNANAHADGLRVFIAPLDQHGRLVPVEGQLEVTLIVQHDTLAAGPDWRRLPEFVTAERQSFLVTANHFSQGEAHFDLPFHASRPDQDLLLAPEALVRVRLSVPGEGAFEAEDAHVCLRPVSRFRDQQRYFAPQTIRWSH